MSHTPPPSNSSGSSQNRRGSMGGAAGSSTSPDQVRSTTGGGLYPLGNFGSRPGFPRVPTNLSMESLDEMESKKRIEAVLSAAGVGEDFLAQYANQLLVAGITSESSMGQATEQELISYGLMRAHSMKVVRYFADLAKQHASGGLRGAPSDSQISSNAGTPFIAHPGSFSNLQGLGSPAGEGPTTGGNGQGRSILVKDFQCHCCMELILSPRTISCGHSFCFRCLESWCESHTTPSCPLCRTSMVARAGDRFTIPQVNQMLNNLVLKLFPNQALRVQQLQDEQANRSDLLKQQHQFTRHPPNSTMVRILKNSAATGSVTEVIESILLQLPRAEFLSIKKRWNNSCDTTPVRLDGLMFNVSAPQLHVIALHHLCIRPGDAFLDVGSGSGVVTAWAALQAGPKAEVVHGVELRDDILHYSLRNFEKQRRFRAPLQVDTNSSLECTCTSNALPQSPVSSPTRKESAFVAKDEEGGDHIVGTGSFPKPAAGPATYRKLQLQGVHRLLRQGEVLSGVIHTVFKSLVGGPKKSGSEDQGDDNSDDDDDYYPSDHSMPISFKVMRTFLEPLPAPEVEELSTSSGIPSAKVSPSPISTPPVEHQDPTATPKFPVCEDDDDDVMPLLPSQRHETKEYTDGCVSAGPQKLRVGVEVMVTAGRNVDDRSTRISRAFATVECGDEEVVFTEKQVLVEETFRSKPYHFASTGPGSGNNHQEPVAFVRYRLKPNKPSDLISDVSDGAPIQNVTVTVESCVKKAGIRKGAKFAAAEVQPAALCSMEANSDIDQVTRPSTVGASLSNIKVFRANGLDVNAAPMKVVKEHLGGYDKIYVGASPGGKAPFKILCDWLKPGGVMVAPYEGYMSVIRKSIDGEIEVERHSSVNFSVLEETTTQQSDTRLLEDFTYVSKLPPVADDESQGLEEDDDMRDLRKHEARVAALEYLEKVATRLPVERDTTVGGRHPAVGLEKSFVTNCCRVPVYGKVIRSLDAVLGEEYLFSEGKGCLMDCSVVKHKENRKTQDLRYWTPSAKGGGDEPETAGGVSPSGDDTVFFDTLGCRVKVVACSCGKAIGAELLEAPLEVGGASPFMPGRTLLCMSYVEPPFDRPTDDEDIEIDDRICCKKCKTLISEVRHVLCKNKEMKNPTTGRNESACLVNSLRTSQGAVGLMPHSILKKEDTANPRLKCFHVACGTCNTILGYKATSPRDVFGSQTYSNDVWECERYGLLINKITNVSAVHDPRQMTLSRLLQRSLGGGDSGGGNSNSGGGAGVGAQLYASLVESFSNMQRESGGTGRSVTTVDGSTTTFTMNLGTLAAANRRENAAGDDDEDDDDDDDGEGSWADDDSGADAA